MMFFFHHYELPAVLNQAQQPQQNPFATGPPAPPPPTLPQGGLLTFRGFNFGRGQQENEVNDSQTSPAADIPSPDVGTDDAHEPSSSHSIGPNHSHLETVDSQFLSGACSDFGVATIVASDQLVAGGVNDLPQSSSDSERQASSERKTLDNAARDDRALTMEGRVLDENLVAGASSECNENDFDLCALDDHSSDAGETCGAYGSQDESNQGVRLRKNFDNC